ncbi:hypothetical protein BDV97DRAFT_364774 [Delphinella strobiligena]|nr:hypothetical protein BDV97DRAFT_364774 [Delphinella strobiligena]
MEASRLFVILQPLHMTLYLDFMNLLSALGRKISLILSLFWTAIGCTCFFPTLRRYPTSRVLCIPLS